MFLSCSDYLIPSVFSNSSEGKITKLNLCLKATKFTARKLWWLYRSRANNKLEPNHPLSTKLYTQHSLICHTITSTTIVTQVSSSLYFLYVSGQYPLPWVSLTKQSILPSIEEYTAIEQIVNKYCHKYKIPTDFTHTYTAPSWT